MAYFLLDLDPIYQILKVKVFGSRGEGKEETVAFYGFSKVLGGRKQAIASICAKTYNESERAEKKAVMVIHCMHSSYPANSNRCDDNDDEMLLPNPLAHNTSQLLHQFLAWLEF